MRNSFIQQLAQGCRVTARGPSAVVLLVGREFAKGEVWEGAPRAEPTPDSGPPCPAGTRNLAMPDGSQNEQIQWARSEGSAVGLAMESSVYEIGGVLQSSTEMEREPAWPAVAPGCCMPKKLLLYKWGWYLQRCWLEQKGRSLLTLCTA